MWLSGSRAFDFIKNPHDYDFTKYEDDPIDYSLLENIPNDQHADIFNIKKNLVIAEFNFLSLPSYDNRINPYSKIKCDLPSIDFFCDSLNKVLNNLYNVKVLYRIEILLEFLENNYKFNPSAKQKELINNLHDCKVDINSYILNAKKRISNINQTKK